MTRSIFPNHKSNKRKHENIHESVQNKFNKITLLQAKLLHFILLKVFY